MQQLHENTYTVLYITVQETIILAPFYINTIGEGMDKTAGSILVPLQQVVKGTLDDT